jgi:hypothetical protein
VYPDIVVDIKLPTLLRLGNTRIAEDNLCSLAAHRLLDKSTARYELTDVTWYPCGQEHLGQQAVDLRTKAS